jgi:hypothetical protein
MLVGSLLIIGGQGLADELDPVLCGSKEDEAEFLTPLASLVPLCFDPWQCQTSHLS